MGHLVWKVLEKEDATKKKIKYREVMKIAFKCPLCNHKEKISISFAVYFFCYITVIGIVPWLIWYFKKTKCPKCQTQMQKITNVNPD